MAYFKVICLDFDKWTNGLKRSHKSSVLKGNVDKLRQLLNRDYNIFVHQGVTCMYMLGQICWSTVRDLP